MRTIFTLFLVISSLQLYKSQVLYEENFEALNIGTIVGQRNYWNSIESPANANNYVVVQNGNNKILSLSGEEAEISTLFNTHRDLGNNFIQVEFDYYTGSATANASKGGVMLVDSFLDSRTGLMISQNDKRIFAAQRYWGIPLQEYTLGNDGNDVFLTENSWVRIGFAFEAGTTYCTFKGPGFYKKFNTGANPDFSNINIVFWITNGIASPAHIFDNLMVTAIAKESLGTGENSASEEISIFPNPTTDLINIKATKKIINAYIYDWAGIRKDVKIEGGKINVKNLPAGSYVLGLKTDAGFISKKFIKK